MPGILLVSKIHHKVTRNVYIDKGIQGITKIRVCNMDLVRIMIYRIGCIRRILMRECNIINDLKIFLECI